MSFLHRIVDSCFEAKAVVLMYHRIAEPASDIWEIAVSSANFEQHLRVLKETSKVVPLKELATSVTNKDVKNSVAITFDDGYLDNYLVARPLLEKYGLPATFFIPSRNLGQKEQFWWDELEKLLLLTEHLPASLAITINNELIEVNLAEEASLNETQKKINRSWKACVEAPPTRRCALYLKLWERLLPMTYSQQQQQLNKLKEWANQGATAPDGCNTMSPDQLEDLSRNRLFDIGAHTASHVSLNAHSLEAQKQELEENKKLLGAITGKGIELLAYPYGKYNKDTLQAAGEAAFRAAFTTDEKVVTRRSHPLCLGRFQVPNFTAPQFRHALKHWKNKT